jgi:hypothetical protein
MRSLVIIVSLSLLVAGCSVHTPTATVLQTSDDQMIIAWTAYRHLAVILLPSVDLSSIDAVKLSSLQTVSAHELDELISLITTLGVATGAFERSETDGQALLSVLIERAADLRKTGLADTLLTITQDADTLDRLTRIRRADLFDLRESSVKVEDDEYLSRLIDGIKRYQARKP